MLQFLFGALMGAFAGYYFRDDLRRYVDSKLPEVRDRAADKLEAFGRGAESALDRAKTQIGQNLRAGQERLRATRRASGGERWPGPGPQ
jgi:hypothetical protein